MYLDFSPRCPPGCPAIDAERYLSGCQPIKSPAALAGATVDAWASLPSTLISLVAAMTKRHDFNLTPSIPSLSPSSHHHVPADDTRLASLYLTPSVPLFEVICIFLDVKYSLNLNRLSKYTPRACAPSNSRAQLKRSFSPLVVSMSEAYLR